MTKKKNPDDLLPRGRPLIDGATPGSVPDDPSAYLQINLLTSQKTWLLAEAERQDISVSELVRQWLEEKQANSSIIRTGSENVVVSHPYFIGQCNVLPSEK